MPQEIHGKLTVGKEKYGIVVTRFNEFITSRLLGGALDGLKRHGAEDDQATVVWVPGAFEVPLAAKKLAQSGKFNAVICLATVIRGQTAHFDYVCQQITRGVGELSMASDVPVLFGVITCDTLDEAINRAGAKSGNVGYSSALSAIEMVQVIDQINKIK
ncbi:MAG: 6,7-dimethyl-8-ribityllumazine synthase [Phycisphaerae bacterium]|nr:6,7-dimethyl-8-ribityllumazine synthase [Phycisphaerae bacterium]